MTNFDERARDWESDPKKVERARLVADAIRKAVPLSKEMTALEYGCGTGLLDSRLQQDGQIHLPIPHRECWMSYRKRLQAEEVTNMHPVRLDLSSDPLPAKRYDLTYSLMTLHHSGCE